MYIVEEEILNGHNEDVPLWPVPPMVEELEIGLVQSIAIPSGVGELTPGGPQIFVHAPQDHWHRVASVGTDTEARERLVALERKVFAFRQ